MKRGGRCMSWAGGWNGGGIKEDPAGRRSHRRGSIGVEIVGGLSQEDDEGVRGACKAEEQEPGVGMLEDEGKKER